MAIKKHHRASSLSTAMHKRRAYHHVPKTHDSPQMMERHLKLCCSLHFDLERFMVEMNIGALGDHIQRVEQLFQALPLLIVPALRETASSVESATARLPPRQLVSK